MADQSETRAQQAAPLQSAAGRPDVAIRRAPGASPSWGTLLGRLAMALACALFVAFISLPLLALLMRVPLNDLLRYLGDPLVGDALRLSGISSLCSLALMVGLGTPVAYLLGRSSFRGKAALETLIELPLVLPPAVAGVALLF